MWTPELEAEYQALKGEVAPRPSRPPSIASNPAAAQKQAEAMAKELGESEGADIAMDKSRNRILPSLDEVDANLETVNRDGGMSPMYDNEELLFGTLPGVKPTIQFLRSQGIEGPGGIIKDAGENLANREVYKASTGQLASQLKNVIRKPGEGTWTDYDQQFLMSLLPTGAGYDTDKRIIQGLREGTLLNKVEDYRRAHGLAPDRRKQKPEVPTYPSGVIPYSEYFK